MPTEVDSDGLLNERACRCKKGSFKRKYPLNINGRQHDISVSGRAEPVNGKAANTEGLASAAMKYAPPFGLRRSDLVSLPIVDWVIRTGHHYPIAHLELSYNLRASTHNQNILPRDGEVDTAIAILADVNLPSYAPPTRPRCARKELDSARKCVQADEQGRLVAPPLEALLMTGLEVEGDTRSAATVCRGVEVNVGGGSSACVDDGSGKQRQDVESHGRDLYTRPWSWADLVRKTRWIQYLVKCLVVQEDARELLQGLPKNNTFRGSTFRTSAIFVVDRGV
ncbi:uncharacterized protein STEHIDRAFT_141673 [Stereum hirsutum FP-91666 SS1]|uniref:uncharacterized protein n=1 Tax=Stereum hirsutum (strain FP-91666) TaxID=721885 RepID=UPI0004449B43|nr:uncharacterized protein STEHIDRAFT_141673 [Stereum hirsutum FP-91666 SS1]EIM82346.1 hypothetical protein STEHIDRAFT_141673 [Stereum hirsutum FP-91666 SS1]